MGSRSGNKKSEDPLSLAVTLDGLMGAENVGLLMAEAQGYFVDAGLEVRLGAPRRPRRPMRYVEERLDSLGVLQQPQLAIARGKGVPVVALGSVISRPTEAMIWLGRSDIDSVTDLRGKTIAITGIPFQERLLEKVLTKVGLTFQDVSVKTLDYRTVPALLSGRADAIFGGSQNLEVVELEERGANPVVTPFEDLGIPSYEELVIVAREDFLAKEPEAVRRFMSAVARGTTAAIEDPRGAMNVIRRAREPNPEISPEVMEAQVAATLPLLSRDGSMDFDGAQGLSDWMYEEGLTPEPLSAATLMTDAYR